MKTQHSSACLAFAKFMLFVGALASGSTVKRPTACLSVLPKTLAEQLLTKFPGWRPKDVSDLGADDHQLWERAHPKECPGATPGHFRDAKSISYAMLLVPDSNTTPGYKLVVADTDVGVNGFSFDVLDHNDSQSSAGMVISKVRPGKYSDFERTESVVIKFDSINVEWIEAAAMLYYWDDHRFRTLQTSD
jgi:hypothetical protein